MSLALFSPRLPSLKARLWTVSLALLPVLLGIAGLALDEAYGRSLLAAQQERMKAQVYLVLAAVEWRDGQLLVPEPLAEPRYDDLSSGLYAFVSAPNGALLWRSASSQALAWAERAAATQALGVMTFREWQLNQRHAFETVLNVVWEHTGGGETPFTIRVVEDAAAWRAERASYRTSLAMSLVGIAAAWWVLLVLLVRLGLRPLDDLAKEVSEIEQGRAELLVGDYPNEVRQLTQRLNQLIRAEREQRERYRHTVEDLAHSLKTPLAVIRGAIGQASEVAEIEAQVARMDQIVAYQLQRAVRSADQRLLKPVDILPVLDRLVATLRKVYPERRIEWLRPSVATVVVAGEERDVMELFGNLLDNACKYAGKLVRLGVSLPPDGTVRLSIEDDGPGIAASAWRQVQKRGVRADQLQAGQGIGLAVAADILASFHGQWQLYRAPLGGAGIEVSLQADATPLQTPQ